MRRASAFAFLALTTGVPAGAVAQARRSPQRIELRVAIDSLSVREDGLVPLAFTGPALALGARYGVALQRHVFDAQLDLGFGMLFNRFGHMAAQIEHGLALGYGYDLCEEPASVIAPGAALRTDTNVAYLASWDDAHGYWLASVGLWPRLDYARPLTSSAQLESRAKLMLVGVASRPPPYRQNKQDAMTHVGYYFDRIGHSPRWLSPLTVQAIELEAQVRFRDSRVSLGRGWGVGGEARFARARDPKPYTSLYLGIVGSYGFAL